ncbi:efflux RND transporter periplasmic adaptor subunit [Granulicella tundricola]|uniref:Efflux transporter, RND family, MFP subunit n=1 Tax=Granulicella tundricola (strain ATCC BAA-1859 / DSM 23138 / MP5ACTX9) TaxID=1198114 RepID=E8X6N9_GRATM|nr:efflux RND transporter periplasmic adaptor subunit [Granulicella tundricola]ADW71189.1 efflux transporter, RND family, MFP subunit [Granulicella tundricola MP5ACTX9]
MTPNQASGSRALILVALLLTAGGCKKTAPADDADKPVITVQAVHPTEGPITEDILADAILAPQAQAALQARITAPVKAFYVQRGAKVKAGQVLATLENQDLAAAALDNKGTYTAAQGTYTTATRQQVPQEETQARLDLEQARSTLALDQSILDARTQLFTQGAIPGRDVDTARSTVIQAKAAFDIAQQKFESIKSVGKTASLETAEGQLTSAKGKYLGAEAQLSYTSIRTPISGIVTERPLFAGETAAAGTAIITVMDTSVLLAKLHLAQRQAQQLALGAEAEIAIPGQDEPVKAKVSLISPALDPGSTTVEVWLKVANSDGKLKAGTAVHATIQGRTIPKALTIPADAVQRSAETGGKMVMIIATDGTAHKRNVTVGIATAETAQITSGLTPSDTVITTGGYGLDDGTKVKVGPAEDKDKADAADAKPAAGEKE